MTQKVKMAEQIEFYLCDHCAAVHIGFYRQGKLFAEAIPDDPGLMLKEMTDAITKSKQRQSGAGSKH
ncbi:MAG: hypothetical protein JWM58_573 [Rhizobium sp.]|nr:hypothetical protein [Rhizobium sp.]